MRMATDVALVVYSLRGGGVERMRIHLAEALHRRGYATAIVVARSDGHHGCYRARMPSGVRLVDLEAHSWKAWLDALTTYLRNEEPRVLLAAMETAGVIALWARRRAEVATRIVVSSHVEVSRHIQSDWNYPKRFLVPYLMRRFYGSADGIVAVSVGVADDLACLAAVPLERIRVIHNPVITDQLAQALGPEARRPRLSERCKPLIIGVGRLTEQKDFPTLVRAFSILRKRRPARMTILGEGEERSSLETLVRNLELEEHVEMPGFVPDPMAYMPRAAVFVLSSAWEGFGNVLVEAMACGCPVVSTDCPSGPREILEGGKYGRLVPVGDHDALSRAILDTLDYPLDPHVLQERAADFHVDKIASQYIEVMGLE